jgi:DNA (cytosine-5)-methyltransferase 1
MNTNIPVIDLFAGPGGLGEGFNAARHGNIRFSLKLSVEKDRVAHQTLLLRSFFWKLKDRGVPSEYYDYISGELSRDDLLKRFPVEAGAAAVEAQCIELGSDSHAEVDGLIEKALDGRSHWVLIGGPPCQAYSLAGRSRNAKVRRASLETFETDKRHRLYEEYLRILAKFRPTLFIMENVKGMLSSQLEGELIFDRIRRDLSQPHLSVTEKDKMPVADNFAGYDIYSLTVPSDQPEDLRPADFVIRAEDHGIPQTRHRVILFGIRKEYGEAPAKLLSEKKSPTVKKMLKDLPRLRSRVSRGKDSKADWLKCLKKLTPMIRGKAKDKIELRKAIKTAQKKAGNLKDSTGSFHKGKFVCAAFKAWFYDSGLLGIPNHEARSHMASDLRRYLFCSAWSKLHGNKSSPTLSDFPKSLMPKHKSAKKAARKKAGFADRFRVQVAGRCSGTIVSHIAKDGHYYIHYDPAQCRSLTVREAARLQTFPDNYFFEGNRTEQYTQVGNAVPPLLARQIAEGVAATMKNILARELDTQQQGEGQTVTGIAAE